MRAREIDMLHGSLWDKIILFAMPLALTGFLQQLYNTADTVIAGRFIGTHAMAAVGTNVSLIGLVVNLFLGVSLGANVMIARYIGSREPDKAGAAVHTAFLLAAAAGALVLAVGETLAGHIMGWLAVPPEVRSLAETYLRVYFLGMPFLALYNFEAAIFRSRGDTETPLLALVVASSLNAVLDYLFTACWGWGTAGLALATVLAQGTAAAILFQGLRGAPGVIHLDIAALRLDRDRLREIVRIGVPAGVQGGVFSLANIVIQSAINSLGADTMAASGAAFTIEINIYCVIYSFGQAATTFVSQNYGAGDLVRCRRAALLSFGLNALCMGLMTAAILSFATPLMRLFDDNPEVIRLGVVRLFYVVGPEILNAVIDVFSGALRGYGFSLPPAVLAVIGICGVRLGWVAFVFPRYPAFETLMLCYPVSWSVTAVLILAAYRFYSRHVPVRRPLAG